MEHGSESGPSSKKPSRAWVFTFNNPEEDTVPVLWKDHGISYCVWQRERGEGGTPHLQGYVVFGKAVRLSLLKRVNSSVHWEPRKGSHEQAKAYCTKEETREKGPWSYGDEPKGSGARTDLDAVRVAVNEGVSDRELWDRFFPSMCRYHKSVSFYRMLTAPRRNTIPEVIVLWGVTNIGKSWYAHEQYPDAYRLSNAPTGVWWDGYAGESTVVIDEFYGWIKWAELLNILDRYDYAVSFRGGKHRLLATRFIFTSNAHPRNWYNYSGPHMRYETLERRLTKILTKNRQEDEWQEEDRSAPSIPANNEADITVSRCATYFPIFNPCNE